MFKLKEIWDNCKQETLFARHKFPFFDKHLTTHERHHTGICIVLGHGTQPIFHG
jgi:hypothetical protein